MYSGGVDGVGLNRAVASLSRAPGMPSFTWHTALPHHHTTSTCSLAPGVSYAHRPSYYYHVLRTLSYNGACVTTAPPLYILRRRDTGGLDA